MTEISTPSTTDRDSQFDVVVIGAGFAGLYALHRLRGLGLSVRVLEAAGGIGGTWHWNAYPGARCDVESYQYSYSFSAELDQEWTWSERYAGQPEILAYIEHVADRFDLRRDIQLNTRVDAATFDEARSTWSVATEAGERFEATYVIFATGSLSAPLAPPFPGVHRFSGESYMTQTWPHEPIDFAGKRVAVIGTGSSGVQLIPVVAERAGHLTVFQRTPNFSAAGRNRRLHPDELAAIKDNYPAHRDQQRASNGGVVLDINRRPAAEMTPAAQRTELEKRWAAGGMLPLTVAFADVLTDPDTNKIVQEFLRDKIVDRVSDPTIAELLSTTNHPFAGKRPCVDHGYFETFNRDNVTLVSIRDNPIAEITGTGVRMSDGTHHEFDMICYANGYDAITGALHRIDIRGRGSLSLREQWAAGPRTYLGLGFAGFPNLFSVAGPGSPAVLAMMIGLAEHNVDWITECIDSMRARAVTTIEPRPQSQGRWTDHVAQTADAVYAYRTAEGSYYKGANVPGKPHTFAIYVGGMRRYRRACDYETTNGYPGFILGAKPHH
ncbi:flavin-containing monooxygenase [Mycolicibacterium llatzerense]|uniref:flavin-containing monooxygenase n=1 Tax=Mycolicibacterium llatzerense TaxID=280871 RepID=UPI0008DDFCA2|nr:NAD(P)/FAD-dependent oxidoreductase [Mycolicibacterium llatzerense]